MPVIAAPPPPIDPFTPPAAYIETPHGLRRMDARQIGDWCAPLSELPAGTQPSQPGGLVHCRPLPQALLTPHGFCVSRMDIAAEVVARPGEQVRFHVAAEVGPATLSILMGDVIENPLGPLAPWTARGRVGGDPVAVARLTATSERGTVVYSARVVVGTDLRRPSARINLAGGKRRLEITPTPGSNVTTCVNAPGEAGSVPVRRRNVRGTLRLPVSLQPPEATILVRSPTGVSRVYRIRRR